MNVALVTGTSRGIGQATARALLERGWSVTGIARGSAPAALQHPGYHHVQLDLADLNATAAWLEESLPSLVPASGSRLGLVNNAAVLAPVTPATRLQPADLARAFQVNTVAPVWLTREVLRLGAGRPVRIVNLSSGAATSAYAGWTAYCASKAALRMAGQVLAAELAETPELRGRDVRVVSYAPHVVATAMQEELRAVPATDFPRRQRFLDLHEHGELVPPEGPAAEIADLLGRDDLETWTELRFQP